MILTKKEKGNLVIQLASQGKTTRQIAKAVHISPKDIGIIIRRFTGEDKDYQTQPYSITSKAFQMFKESMSRVDVAIALNLETDHVVTLFEDYMQLLNLDKLMAMYKDLGDGIYLLDYLFHHMKYEGIATKNAISRFAEMAGRLTRLDEEELKICEQIGNLNSKKFELEREAEELTQVVESYDIL